MKLVVTANGLDKAGLEPVMELASRYFSTVIMNPWGRRGTQEEIKAIWEGADAIICGAESFDEQMISQAPASLKVLSHYGVGVDSIDIPCAKAHGIKVCNTPGANSISVAEMAMCLILSTARQIPSHDRFTRLGQWKRFASIEIFSKTLGLIGFGAIGQEVAKRAEAFGMKVLAYDPFFNESVGREHKVRSVGLDELLGQSDFISLHLPCTEKTQHIINADTIGKMKSTAILINTARGELVDEEALYNALKSRQLAGAGLDVYSKEPVKDSKLFELDNVVLTPHCSANTVQASLNMGLMAVENAYRALMNLDGAHVL